MKSNLLFFLFSTTISASSHPLDSTSYLQIPIHSQIVITQDINVLPRQSSIRITTGESKIDCEIDLYWHTSNEDRILKAGTTFDNIQIDSVLGFFGQINLELNNKIYKLNCNSFRIGQNNFRMTIGEFKDAISSTAKLIVAPPKEF